MLRRNWVWTTPELLSVHRRPNSAARSGLASSGVSVALTTLNTNTHLRAGQQVLVPRSGRRAVLAIIFAPRCGAIRLRRKGQIVIYE